MITLIYLCIEISDDCFIWLVGQFLKEDSFRMDHFFIISFHVKSHKSSTGSIFYCVFFHFVKVVTHFWVFIQKSYLWLDYLKETHLKSNLSHCQSQARLFWEKTDKGIASISWTEYYSHLSTVKDIDFFVFFFDCEDSTIFFVLLGDNLPDVGVDSSPLDGVVDLGIYSNVVKAKIVGLDL